MPARGASLILQRLFAFCLALSVFVAVALYFRSPNPVLAGSSLTARVDADRLPAASVLKIDPAAGSRSRNLKKPAAPSLAVQAYLQGRDWPGLYRQLASSPATAEGQYLQAEMLVNCAKRSPGAVSASVQKRDDFIAQLPRNDPNLAKRVAAYDSLHRDRCGDISQVDYNEAEAYRLIAAAADAGDARARAWLLSRELQRTYQTLVDKAKADNTQRPAGLVMNDQQFSQLLDLLSTQDPLVINELREVLASSFANSSLRIGANQETVDQPSMYYALGLVACDFGAPCGQDTPQMAGDCAANSHCDASNLYDQTYYYNVPPYGAQLVEQYRAVLTQMITSHDFSALTLNRVPSTVPGSLIYNLRRGP